MKSFILLNSPILWEETAENEQYLSPLGLAYIATYLDKDNVQTKLLDCVKQKLSINDALDYINRKKPNYVGINIFTQNYEIVKYFVEKLKNPCECFIGGQVVKCIYEEILLWNSKNPLNIIIGEGEYIIPAIVSRTCVERPIMCAGKSKVYKVDKESAYYPEDISNLELNRSFITDEIVINHYGEKECAIVTSRGCAFNCAFCGGAKSLNSDITIRIRDEKSVIKEIEEIIRIYPNVRSIRILDDLFLRNGQSIDMAYNIFNEFPKLKWRGMVHALSLTNAMNKIYRLRDANCSELFMGIESGSSRVRKYINKLGSKDDIIKVATEIMNVGIDLKGYFIYGFPQETENDFKETYELALQLKKISDSSKGNFRTSVFQFRPYHGTRLYNEIVSSTGILKEPQLNHAINRFAGRTQFNVAFGNYSATTDEILNEYIIKTQEI